VENRDRLARVGTKHLHAALAAHRRRIVVVDDAESTDDLVGDTIEVLTSMALYGRRGARGRCGR
jgi:putative resolvase